MTITYILRSTVYVALTNRANARSLIETRGPGFSMPASSGFAPLPPKLEPTAAEVRDAVRAALLDERMSSGAKEVCFAGAGEPLLRQRCLAEAAGSLRSELGEVPLRLSTNGLVPASEARALASDLRTWGMSSVNVALASADPVQYRELMQPHELRLSPAFSLPLGHDEVTGFVAACVAAGLAVECNAVAAPGVDVPAAAALARSLGASFRERSWHA
jgi:molybdenum cofactor biosynthesis enzyme MoaA